MSNFDNQVHFTMQGKGGVGKSLTASLQAQYFTEKCGNVQCFDTDPVNDTLTQYTALKATRINVLNSDSNINARAFDQLMEKLFECKGVAVVDNGASTFIPAMAYMVENQVVDMLQAAGKRVFIHSVLTGGQALSDTVTGLTRMLEVHPAPVVVWLNEFFGDVKKDGKSFQESAVFRKYQDRIQGIVKLERRNADTFGVDMETMVRNKLTFEQALQSPEFGVMAKQRLKMMKTAIFDQLDSIEFDKQLAQA